MENVDQDQLASSEASCSGSTFSINSRTDINMATFKKVYLKTAHVVPPDFNTYTKNGKKVNIYLLQINNNI